MGEAAAGAPAKTKLSELIDDIDVILDSVKAVDLNQTWKSDPIVVDIAGKKETVEVSYQPTAGGVAASPESLASLAEAVAVAAVDIAFLKTAGSVAIPIAASGHTGTLTVSIVPGAAA
jgi:hypothetical protein